MIRFHVADPTELRFRREITKVSAIVEAEYHAYPVQEMSPEV